MVAKLSKFSKRKTSLLHTVIVSAVFFGIFGGIIGFFVYQNITIGQKRVNLENQLQELRAKAVELETQRQNLQQGIANTQTEEYQEELLRGQGLYQKEGEQAITVLEPEVSFVPVSETEEESSSWWNPFSW